MDSPRSLTSTTWSDIIGIWNYINIVELNGVIYKYTSRETGMSYVGLTFDEKRRQKEHRKESKTSHRKFHLALNEQGYDAFDYEVLEEGLTVENISEREKFYIDKFNTVWPNGYNMTSGGQITTRCDETRRRLSESHMGEGNPFYGKTHGEDHLEWLRTNMKGEGNPMYGRNHTEASKTLQRESWDDERRNRMRTIKKKTYLLVFKDGTSLEVTGLQDWAKDNGYVPGGLYTAASKGKSYRDILSITQI